MAMNKFIFYGVLILFLIIISYVAAQEIGIISGYASGSTVGAEVYISDSSNVNATNTSAINTAEEISFWEQFLDWLGIR